MGACCGNALDENTKMINSRLDAEYKETNRLNKLLFLGPGGSGKSTIFKQLQWLHAGGFTKTDALMLREHIYCQVTNQMKAAIEHYYPKLSTSSSSSSNENENEHESKKSELESAITVIRNHGDVTVLHEKLAAAVEYVWRNDPLISKAFKNMETGNQNDDGLILDGTSEYFWNEIDRIKHSHYVPNEQDIINVRYRTTGVIDKVFEVKKAKFHIFDVGGQKSERKKWINCFNEVKALIFVISLSCYNEKMYEDLMTNCMVDSLKLFADTINNKHFADTHIILFLNKRDLFEKKILRIPLTICPAFADFEDYNHETTIMNNPHDYEQCVAYIRQKFERLNESSKRKQIYTHLTCAMDKKNIENVFNDVKHIVITQNLFNEGLS